MRTKITFSILLVLAFSFTVIANNLKISPNPILKNLDTGIKTVDVAFGLNWENSWRTDLPGAGNQAPFNHDAVWVFMKFKAADGIWKHATLRASGHSTPAGASLKVSNDRLGAFIYRSANGIGNVNFENIHLRWDYNFDGLEDLTDVTVQVYGIEMVYIPQGSFSVGDGNTDVLLGVFHSIGSTNPYVITSEEEITLGGTTTGNLGNSHTGNGQHSDALRDDFNNASAANEKLLPASFPKGYNAFYIMKYNITQKQYVDFLNTLTRTQQNTRTATTLSSALTSTTNRFVLTNSTSPISRNGIRVDATFEANVPLVFYNDLNDDGNPNQADDGQYLPCNFLSFADGAAYLDWSGLRPLTELEYEKACRGPQAPVINEMAWGQTYQLGTTVIKIAGILNAGTDNELPSNADANSHIDNNSTAVAGPVRTGIFATPGSDRTKSGATYYGVMDMGGNLTEQIISLGKANGRTFDGRHGSGSLNSTGFHDVVFWPGANGATIDSNSGAGIRSNSYMSVGLGSRISVRRFVNDAQGGRVQSMGVRGVRTAE